ncbi:MAG: Na+/H+ antiporter NhaA [Isosphaera sp.]|nr:Na+/H+ antiporter NhaA [Isosphaera sp.]
MVRHTDHPAGARHLPHAPIRRLARPLARFLRVESASGLFLLACAAVALGVANSPAADAYRDFWHTPVRLQVGGFTLGGDLGHFVVNDVLMTVFFFLVGLEIKRELVAGELRDARKAALPVVAAVGGMVVPAGLYLALQAGRPGERGWGVPMATDIAFVVGIMALLGPRVPLGLKILVLALAIVDDIGAVVVIAVFYADEPRFVMLLLAAGGLALTAGLARAGVRSVPVYVVVGAGVWLATYKSGVHPTIAGVLLGLMTPAGEWVSRTALRLSVADLQARLATDPGEEVAVEDLELLAFAARESVSPLERLEHALHPWVGFLIMPLFALANAGVKVEAGAVTSPVAVAAAVGLFLGKPVGVMLFSLLAVRLGLARLPQGVTWWVLFGGGCLAGIGFTMSLFVAGLAFPEKTHWELLAAAKTGTLVGSVCSAAVGVAVLRVVLRRAPAAPA